MNQNAATNEYAARQLAAAAARLLTPKEFVVEPRAYFHQHNGAKFHVDLGKSNVMTIMFANYRVVTDDKRVQEQLDLVADQPGTFIYTMPQNEAARIIEHELQIEKQKQVMQTAAAQAGVHNQQFDPNTPIVPVITQAQQMPMTMQQMPSYSAPGTGMQNSFSGTQATDALTAQMTKPSDQTAAPSSTTAALDKLTALKNQATPTVDFAKVLEEAKTS